MTNRTQHDRFKDAPWFPKEDIYVLIGGAGSIGSWTSLLLARAGFKPIVYDDDTIEETNLAGQLYSRRMIKRPKVDALFDVVADFADETIVAMNNKITKISPSHTYCISAFDNMLARKDMFESWEEGHGLNSIFIDGRLEAEWMRIYCVTASNTDRYKEKLLIEDKDLAEAPCTMKQTSHSAAMIASHIVGFFTNHITNVVEKATDRKLPFMWEYFIPLSLTTEVY